MTALAPEKRIAADRQRTRRGPRKQRAWAARISLVTLIILAAIVVLGPFLRPHDPEAILGPPYAKPSDEFPLGLDYLGGDVLSRLLSGGQSVALLATTATALGYSVGLLIGLVAGMSRNWVDPILMRLMDLLLAFPALLLILLVIAGLGTGRTALVIGIAVLQVPFVARIIRSSAQEVSTRGYVEAAVARGESTWRILFREMLPSVRSVIVATAGPAFTASILTVAGLSFLGLGLQAPQADWALMITENRQGLELNPWATIPAIVLIAALTLSVTVLAEADAPLRKKKRKSRS